MPELRPTDLQDFLSPEALYADLSRTERQRRRGDALTALLLLILSLLMVEPSLNQWLKQGAVGKFLRSASTEAQQEEHSPAAGGGAAPDPTPVQKHEVVAGYPVTSGYGERPKPCAICSKYHWGVDVGTPIGTPLHAIGTAGTTTEVICKSEKLGGNYALIRPEAFPEWQFMAMHLQDCTTGTYKPGEVFGHTGASGAAITGASLDWRQYDLRKPESTGASDPGQRVHPHKGFLLWTLKGEAP
jgi:hypothetical protein